MKRAPIAFRTIEREDRTNFLLFDNGCELYFKNGEIDPEVYELIQNWLIKTSFFKSKLNEIQSDQLQNWQSCWVNHPFRDSTNLNFEDAYFTSDVNKITSGERNMIKTWFELGLFTKEDLVFCHVKKIKRKAVR